MDSSMEKKRIEKISQEKMHFRVISTHPVYTDEMAMQIKQDMRRELVKIFKNGR